MEDKLMILIEGDATGLTSVLKRAADTVKQNVQRMNDQQVNWDAILAKTISPTIITAVAGTFATALAQYINFSNAATNLNNIGTAATNDFANSIGTAGGQAYTMAIQANQSLGNTAMAYNAFQKAGLNAAASQYAVQEASSVAFATGEDYNSVVQELVTLFNQWGVTTLPQVQESLTGLANAAHNGQFSFDELVSAISQQGPMLQAKTNISDVAINLAALSTTSGLTKASILDTFNAVASATGTTAVTMNAAFNGAAKAISTGPNGLITAFQDIKTAVDREGTLVATSFGQQVGLMNSDVLNFSTQTQASFKDAGVAADTLRSHLEPIDSLLSQNTSAAGKLSQAWNDFKTNLAEFVLPPALGLFTADLQEINSLFASFSKGGWTSVFDNLSQSFSSLVKQNPNNPLGGLLGGLGSSTTSLLGGPIMGVLSPLLDLIFGSKNAPSASAAPQGNTTSTNISVTQNISSGAGSNTNPLLQGNSLADSLSKLTWGQQA